MDGNRVLLNEKAMERSISRITHEILEKNQGTANLSLIGIRTRGVFLARRIRDKIKEIENRELPVGILDITMYRDDIAKLKAPEVKKTDISFNVNNMNIVLVDDVLYTGRTTRAAIDAIMDLGRPNKIQLAVLVDRGARELTQFFHECLREFLAPDLSPLGRRIIECCLDGGVVADYEALLRG